MKCSRKVAYDNGLGGVNYESCGRPVKFLATYKSGITGKQEQEHICGVHANSLKAWSKRMTRKMDFDTSLIFTAI